MKPKQHSTAVPVNNTVTVDTANNKGGLKNGVAGVSNDLKTNTINYLCVDNFIQFRKAVCQGDVAKVQNWFKFPLLKPNGIWQLIYIERGIDSKNSNRPFTRKDFWKFFNRIFTDRFIKCIAKIEPEGLRTKGEASSLDF